MSNSNGKAKHFLTVAVKILIVVIALIFIIHRLTKDWSTLAIIFDGINTSSLYLNIAILLLITIINWFIDSKRWQLLVRHLTPITFINALQQTLAAHTSAFVTPAKTGEYGTKALLFPKAIRKKILLLNFLANMYQLTATLIFGVIGGTYVFLFIKEEMLIWWGSIVFFTLVFALLIPRNINRLRWSVKGYSWQHVQQYIHRIPSGIKQRAQLLSFLKYLVFSHQFYLILLFLDVTLPYETAMALIASMYLLSSLVPVMQFFDVVLRGGGAVLLFGWVGIDASTVLIVTTLMWVLNVVLPLLPGSYFLFTLRLKSVNSKME